MQSSTILNPERPGDDFKVQQEQAFIGGALLSR